MALSRLMVTVKFFRVISRIEWFNGEQTNVFRTISVLILRVVTDWIPSHPKELHCNGLTVFKNRVLRTLFGPKRKEGAGGWRKLNNEQLHNLYASSNVRVIKSKRMRRKGHVARLGGMRNAYNILVGKPEGKNHLEDLGVDGSITLEWILVKRGWKGVNWIHLAQVKNQWRALVNRVMNLRVP
jgi:hypothetical protein